MRKIILLIYMNIKISLNILKKIAKARFTTPTTGREFERVWYYNLWYWFTMKADIVLGKKPQVLNPLSALVYSHEYPKFKALSCMNHREFVMGTQGF